MIETFIHPQTSRELTTENQLPYDALSLIQRYGTTETIAGHNGEKITIVPLCEVPVEYLQPANWKLTTNVGNFRSVKSIDRLETGEKPKLYVKSPERTYTGERSELDQGTVWWGGPRSGQKRITVDFHPLIEEQAEWEAAILLTLNAHGINAEKPQAIITYPDGKKAVVVREINDVLFSPKTLKGPSYQTMLQAARTLGMIPEDATEYNCLRDESGYNRIIDVNRWQWYPYTEIYKNNLFNVISSEAAKAYSHNG